MAFTAQQAKDALLLAYPNAKWDEPVDAVYASLTLDGFQKLIEDFHAWLSTFKDEDDVEIIVYQAEKGDCDDFSVLFKSYLILRNWITKSSTMPRHCCIGHYTTGWGERHSICFPVLSHGGKLTAYAIEPQPGGEVKFLSNEEAKTVTFLYG